MPLSFITRKRCAEAGRCKQLERQINSQFYERTALSQNKAGMLVKGQRQLPDDKVSADEEIRNPFLLEFLGSEG